MTIEFFFQTFRFEIFDVQKQILEPCPQGHGGTEGKRCAYLVDERYLASLGLLCSLFQSAITWRLPKISARYSQCRQIPGSTSRIFQSCLEKINFGPPVKSNRYFLKLPRRMPHRTIFAESVQKRCSNVFSF